MATLVDRQWVENRPTKGFRGIDPRELWQYRELAFFLALRDLKVRYKQAIFGIAWALLQPLAGAAVFTLVFVRLARVPNTGDDYPLFAFVGLAVWAYFSGSVTKATQSLVNNSALVTKIYFPRLLAPVAAVAPGLVDLSISLLFLVVLVPAYGASPNIALLTLPLWIAAAAAVALGVGLWLGTMNVRYRDVNQAISLIVQLWLFLSPVAYPLSAVPERWQHIYALNPMVGVLEGFRWSLIGAPWGGSSLVVSLIVGATALAGGILFFQHAERRFADVI